MVRWSFFLAIVVVGGALLLEGCNACYNRPSNPEQVREATANATAEIKNDTKAVAEGVRDGLRRPSSDKPLDLNTASKGQLTSLPGISDDTAARIAENRPYRTPHDLLDRRLVSREEYNRIADRITVK
jgi:DNA uptake protein ComE-like DNA-binding protein